MSEIKYASFVHVIEDINLTIGLILCCFLLYCLLFRTTTDLGQYRYLQITMITIDAAFTATEFFIRERILTADGVFAMTATADYVKDKTTVCIYTSFYTLTFVMIDYNFLYRMWAVKSPLRVRLFSNKSFIVLLFSLVLLELTMWFASVYFLYIPTDSGRLRLRKNALLEYGIDTTSRDMVMGDFFLENGSYSIRHLCAVSFSCSVMGLCFGFMIFAIFDIIHELRMSTSVSKKTIRLQRQLFATLCLQTLIPFIFLYAPCGINILLPLFRIDCQWIARVTPILISFFLPCDSFATILSMTDCRRELFKILGCRCFSVQFQTESVETTVRKWIPANR